ncbi:hypothetical protein EVAR_20313_1 [Eumeta japonica]|uniref:Uncharacterized protein n=1 Tax=Eumeta variegata TaxID=151549 RepID=A0A4C1VPS4_EUMVA|nr:hypothetical protein EVAR_20313_1 [Eumeta japonica]
MVKTHCPWRRRCIDAYSLLYACCYVENYETAVRLPWTMGRTLYVSSKLTYIMTNTRVWSDASWTMGRTLYVSSKLTYIMTNTRVWSDASVNNGPYFVRKQQANLYNDEYAWATPLWSMGRTLYVSSKLTYIMTNTRVWSDASWTMGRTLYVSSKLTYIMTNMSVWSDASWTMGRTLYVSSKLTYIMTNTRVWSDASVVNGPYFVRKQQANLYNDEHACMERRLREQWAVLCT